MSTTPEEKSSAAQAAQHTDSTMKQQQEQKKTSTTSARTEHAGRTARAGLTLRLRLCAALGVVFLAALWAVLAPLVRLMNIGETFVDRNVDKCRLIAPHPELQGCEDIDVHAESGTVLLACSSLKEKQEWNPMLGITGAPTPGHRDPLFVLDPHTFRLTRLRFADGFRGDFRVLGSGLLTDPHDPAQLLAFFINYRVDGGVYQPCVEIFAYTPGSDLLRHLETVVSDGIVTPNAILPVSRRAFYVTNSLSRDHRSSSLLMAFELLTARPWSNVVFRGEDLRVTEAARGIVGANGITADPARLTVFVASSTTRKVVMYERSPASGALRHIMDIPTGRIMPDNLKYDARSDSVYTAGLLDVRQFFPAMGDPLNFARKTAWAAMRLGANHTYAYGGGMNSTAGELNADMFGWVPEEIVTDATGRLTSLASGATPLPNSRAIVVGSITRPGFVYCNNVA